MKKYIRKIVLFSTVFVMLACIVIGIGVIFAVKNVNVTLYSYAYEAALADGASEADAEYAEQEKLAAEKQIILDELRGTVIAFVNEQKVSDAIAGSGYTVESIAFEYPCTVNVTLRERRATFAVWNGFDYDVYDETGAYMYSGDNVNPLDGAANIVVSKKTDGALKNNLGEEEICGIAQMSSVFRKYFNGLRSLVEGISIIYEGVDDYAISHIVFSMRSGLDIRIYNFGDKAEEKIAAAFARYSGLDGEQKLSGEIFAMIGFDDEIVADYQKSVY